MMAPSSETKTGASQAAQPILPGATLGMLGSGQLGRMFAQAAARLGYFVHVFSPDAGSPTSQVARQETIADYDDTEAVAKFAQSVDVVSFEFENVSAAATETIAKYVPVRPAGRVLHITQDRLREKRFLQSAGIPCTPFAEITSSEELSAAVDAIGTPAVLKTTAWGYDGKGQAKINAPADAQDDCKVTVGGVSDADRESKQALSASGDASHNHRSSWVDAQQAWQSLDGQPVVYEGWVDYQQEFSVLVTRSTIGEIAICGPIANEHANHILDLSVYPAPELADAANEAAEIARTIVEQLDVVGIICVEFFLTTDNRLLVNEIAPRPHNSGHLTIEACRTSQFEQQVRAICGLPLGESTAHCPAAMANLLGDLWQSGEPNWQAALTDPHVHLHLYGKAEARPARKMGHLTVLADTAEEAIQRAIQARDRLTKST